MLISTNRSLRGTYTLTPATITKVRSTQTEAPPSTHSSYDKDQENTLRSLHICKYETVAGTFPHVISHKKTS